MSGIKRFDYSAMKREFAHDAGTTVPRTEQVSSETSIQDTGFADDTMPVESVLVQSDAETDNSVANLSDSRENEDDTSEDEDENEDEDDTIIVDGRVIKRDAMPSNPSVSTSANPSAVSRQTNNQPFVDPSDDFKKSFDDAESDDVPVAGFDEVDDSSEEDSAQDRDTADNFADREPDSRKPLVSDDSLYHKPSDIQTLPRQSAQKRPASIYDKPKSGFSVIKNIPGDVVDVIRHKFPLAENNTQALIAYVYYKEGCPASMRVDPEIKEIVKTHLDDNVTPADLQTSFEDNLRSVDKRLRSLLKIVNAIELGLAYNICDNAGFRVKDQTSPGDLEFLEQAVVDIVNRLNDQSELNQSRIETRNGRRR